VTDQIIDQLVRVQTQYVPLHDYRALYAELAAERARADAAVAALRMAVQIVHGFANERVLPGRHYERARLWFEQARAVLAAEGPAQEGG
jgi:hypothetical protein